MKERSTQHHGWIDLLRIIACFLVVASHCSDPFLVSESRSDFIGGWVIGSIARCSVPLFVMISGALLLPTSLGTKAFYAKRIKRIAIPLTFWSIALPLLFYIYINWGGGSSFPLIPSSSYTLEDTCTKALTFPLNFNYDTTPLWYLYMLVGLYFIIPIISTWIKNSSRDEVKNVLKLWFATQFLPYIEFAAQTAGFIGYPGNSHILGVCDWNIFGTFYYVSGFIGYLLLGYYWTAYPPQWSWRKILCISIPSFIIGTSITFLSLDLLIAYLPQFTSYAWLFSIVHVFLITFPLFVIIQKMNIKPSKKLAQVASTSFGIYLSHFIFIHINYDLLQQILPAGTPSAVHVLCNSIITFITCHIIIRIMYHCRQTRLLVA